MSVADTGGDGLLAELLEAMGGASRIGRIRSYAREAMLTWTPAPVREDARGEGGSPAFRAMARAGVHTGRETTFRAAPGRARVEITVVEASLPERRALLAIAGPDAPHDYDHGRGRDEGAGDDGGAPCAACAGAAVLLDAAYEPRNLLAHARERGAIGRALPDGSIEVVVPDPDLLYRFDPVTHLCAGRTAVHGGTSTLYQDWRYVDGVATPFLEIELDARGRLDRRVLGVAYDLSWPQTLFLSRPR